MAIRWIRAAALGAALLVSLSACAASSGTPAAPTTTTPPAATAAGGTTALTPGPTTGASVPTATSVVSRGGVISVDLTLTGTQALILKGTAGECHIGRRSDGTGSFEYWASPGDYPGIGDGMFITETKFGSDPAPILGIKLLAPAGPWFGDFVGGFQFSTDHKTLTIDADLPTTPGKPEHIKGTVVCA